MGAESTVQYQIAISRTGAGATEAVNEFKAVEAAAAKTNATLATGTTATTTLTATTKTATSSLKAMQGTLQLIGLQTFPQLTLAAQTAQTAFGGVKTAAAAAGVSIGVMGAQLGVITLGAYAAVKAVNEFFQMLGAQKQESTSEASFAAQIEDQASRLKDVVADLVVAGRMAREEGEGLFGTLDEPTDAGNRAVRERIRAIQDQIAAEQDLYKLHNEAVLDTLQPDARERIKEHEVFKQRMDQIKILKERMGDLPGADPELIPKALEQTEAAYAALQERWMNARKELSELQMMAREAVLEFAGGFSQAFVAFASGTKSAKEAFTDFARSFLSQMAQMIMQQMILNAIKSTSWGSSLFAAEGGMFPRYMAAGGMQGVADVSSPTYFPKFNVVAGEAGREMMTVLARPRMMEVGGMQAVVGSAQGQQLAITSAADLAGRGGAGGTIVIQVQGTPDFEARVIQNSVKGAVVQVATDMRQDTPISRGVKGLTA